jgi:hypothetical protein
MSTFIHSQEVPLAAQSLLGTMGDVLESLAARSETGGITLSAPVGKSEGTISVPITLAVTRRSRKDASIGITIKARSGEKIFPQFKGAFYALAMSPARTILRLKGTYTVPLGPLGSTINAAGLHKMAEISLHDLFERVVNETTTALRDESTRRYLEARAVP